MATPSLAAGPSSEDWPTYLHDTARSGNSPVEPALPSSGIRSLHELWTYDTASPVASSATVVGGTVFVGSWNGYEYALNASTGAVEWKTFLGLKSSPGCGGGTIGVSSAATVENGTVYVGGGNATFYALAEQTGAIEWQLVLGSSSSAVYLWASPLVYRGMVYIGTASQCTDPFVLAKLLLVNATSGSVVRTFLTNPKGITGASIWGSPTLDPKNNSVFFATGSGGTLKETVFVLNASTLKLEGRWSIPFAQRVPDGDFGNTPTLLTDSRGDRWIEVANKNGIAYAFNETNISSGPVWEDHIAVGGPDPTNGQGSISPGTFMGGVLYLGGGHTVINGLHCSGSVRAVDPWTGAYLWQYCAPGVVLGGLASVNGMIVVAAGHTLVILNASTGLRVWHEKLDDALWASPSVAEGKIFESTTEGTVYALGE
ncbi:MAG: PQQ-binding-like beta-propeller repeat protein [Thermoplasmata archaeon]